MTERTRHLWSSCWKKRLTAVARASRPRILGTLWAPCRLRRQSAQIPFHILGTKTHTAALTTPFVVSRANAFRSKASRRACISVIEYLIILSSIASPFVDLFEDKPRVLHGVPNLNVGTDVPLPFTAFGRVIKPPAMRVVVYLRLGAQ
jgi:hypothetical protein